MNEFWHVVVDLPEYNKIDTYYFETKKLVLQSIMTTYSKCPRGTISTEITDDNVVVTEGDKGVVITAKRVLVPRDIRTSPDHF
jgi:hypothetical protein